MGIGWGGFWVIAFVLIVSLTIFLLWNSPDRQAARARRRQEVDRRKAIGEIPDFLDLLPKLFYFLAIFCGIVLLIATIVNFDKLSDAERGAMIGYTVGSVLSMFAVGRVIDLLRKSHIVLSKLIEIEKFKLKPSDSNPYVSSPALSPSRPDDE